MTLRQLEYLVTVVDEGSFGRAALALYVSQPTLSSQVRALEDEIGGPLLERLPRGVQPTPTGEAMLPAARAALAGEMWIPAHRRPRDTSERGRPCSAAASSVSRNHRCRGGTPGRGGTGQRRRLTPINARQANSAARLPLRRRRRNSS